MPTHISSKHLGEAERLLRTDEILSLMGISRSTLNRLRRSGRFPPPVVLGSTNRWPEGEIVAFSDHLKAERAAEGI